MFVFRICFQGFGLEFIFILLLLFGEMIFSSGGVNLWLYLLYSILPPRCRQCLVVDIFSVGCISVGFCFFWCWQAVFMFCPDLANPLDSPHKSSRRIMKYFSCRLGRTWLWKLSHASHLNDAVSIIITILDALFLLQGAAWFNYISLPCHCATLVLPFGPVSMHNLLVVGPRRRHL